MEQGKTILCHLRACAGKAVWKLDDPAAMREEIAERAAAAASAARKKLEGAVERKATEIKKLEGIAALPSIQVSNLQALQRGQGTAACRSVTAEWQDSRTGNGAIQVGMRRDGAGNRVRDGVPALESICCSRLLLLCCAGAAILAPCGMR